MTAGARFRKLIDARGCVCAPGVCDVLSAKILTDLGFNALYLGGNALGLAHAKAQPFVTLTETTEAVSRISRVTDAALVVDAGAGFGEPAHIAQAAREIERAGAAAFHIDDQPFPKSVNYHRGRGELVSAQVMAARLRIARDALRGDTMLIARTDALRVSKSTEEVIARANSYLAAGADMLLVLDAAPASMSKLRDALPGAMIAWIGGVSPPVPSAQALKDAGFSLALYPFNTVAAMAGAVRDVWGDFAETGEVNATADFLARMRAETLDIVDMQDYWDIEDAQDE
ncbi:MAG: isocitrate lyase/PEP mutase family protein [Parvularculaceae bacterium]